MRNRNEAQDDSDIQILSKQRRAIKIYRNV